MMEMWHFSQVLKLTVMLLIQADYMFIYVGMFHLIHGAQACDI